MSHELNKAIHLAVAAHGQQVDKSGVPYIFHPLRVMEAARAQGYSEALQIAAVLHDIVEDTPVGLNGLTNFGLEVVHLVDLLSRRETETHLEYLHRVITDDDAIRIKVLDTHDNMSPARFAQLASINPGQAQSLMRRYEESLKILQLQSTWR